MKNKLKLILALAASVAVIAIGQRSQSVQKDGKTQKAQVQDVDGDNEVLFV